MDTEKETNRGCPPGEGTVKPEHGGQIGNPPHEYDPDLAHRIELLAAVKSKKQIARHERISHMTITRFYEEAYQRGLDNTLAQMAKTVIQQAGQGNAHAAMWYLSRRGKDLWSNRVEVTGKDGGPVEHVDLSRLSAEQLEEYGRLAAIAAGRDPATALEPSGLSLGEGAAGPGAEEA